MSTSTADRNDSQDSAASTTDVPDEIVRSVSIAADAATVFEIVSEPGWFINDGEYREHEIVRDGDTATVTDPVHGTFHIATDLLEPPRRAVFRWLGGIEGSLEDAPANTVEFTIEDEGNGVVLTVVEKGFAGISADAAERRSRYEGNVEGWAIELELARTLAEQPGR